MSVQAMDLLPDLAAFRMVADAPSLSAAARASGIPVARLSRRLAALERALGVQLIDRTSRRSALTDDGQVLRELVGHPLDHLEEAIQEMRDRSRVPQGTLRITASPDFGAPFLSPIISAFAGQHPLIEFDIDLSPRQVDLRAERFDAAIRVGPLEDSELTARRLATVPSHLYASPEYLRRHGIPSHPSDLAVHHCLPLPHMRGAARLHRGEELVDAVMSGPAKVNNLVMLRRLCGDGLGIAALNGLVASDGGDHCPVVKVLPEWTLEPAVFYFLTTSRLLPARTRAFFDFARASLAAQGY